MATFQTRYGPVTTPEAKEYEIKIGKVTMTQKSGHGLGDEPLEAGAFYCPYVPLTSFGVEIDPVTFEPVVKPKKLT